MLIKSGEHAVTTGFLCTEGNLHQLPLHQHQNQQSAVVSVISVYSDGAERRWACTHTCLWVQNTCICQHWKDLLGCIAEGSVRLPV